MIRAHSVCFNDKISLQCSNCICIYAADIISRQYFLDNRNIAVYKGKNFQPFTVNHFIFTASKFGDFKRLSYWHSLILTVYHLMPFKVITVSHRGYFKGKNMLYMEHILFFISSPF